MFDPSIFTQKYGRMNHEQKNNELYALVYSLITELDSLKTSNAQLQKENIFLKQELEKYRTPKTVATVANPHRAICPNCSRRKVCENQRKKNQEASPVMKAQPWRWPISLMRFRNTAPIIALAAGKTLAITKPVLLAAVRLSTFRPLSQSLPNTNNLRCIAGVGTTIRHLILKVFLPRSAMDLVYNHWFPTWVCATTCLLNALPNCYLRSAACRLALVVFAACLKR